MGKWKSWGPRKTHAPWCQGWCSEPESYASTLAISLRKGVEARFCTLCLRWPWCSTHTRCLGGTVVHPNKNRIFKIFLCLIPCAIFVIAKFFWKLIHWRQFSHRKSRVVATAKHRSLQNIFSPGQDTSVSNDKTLQRETILFVSLPLMLLKEWNKTY